MTERPLTKTELKKVKASGTRDLEVIQGQDHYWWIYSKEINAYMCLDIRVTDCEEEFIMESLNEMRPQNDPGSIWTFGEDFDV